MKLVSYVKDGHEQLAVLINGFVYDTEVLHPDLPGTMSMFLNYWEDSFPVAQAGELLIKEGTRTSNDRVQQRNMGASLSLSRRGHQIKRSTSSPHSHPCELTAAAPAAECLAPATRCLFSNYETMTTRRKR